MVFSAELQLVWTAFRHPLNYLSLYDVNNAFKEKFIPNQSKMYQTTMLYSLIFGI